MSSASSRSAASSAPPVQSVTQLQSLHINSADGHWFHWKSTTISLGLETFSCSWFTPYCPTKSSTRLLSISKAPNYSTTESSECFCKSLCLHWKIFSVFPALHNIHVYIFFKAFNHPHISSKLAMCCLTREQAFLWTHILESSCDFVRQK